MEQLITPDKQSVEDCLSKKTYYIDFYQREYVWSKNTVEILLRDIFDTFIPSYEQYKDADLTPEVLDKFNWYYLNVFITNKIGAKVYIVDGQQRLTTLSLIATKLYHMVDDDNLKESIKNCISTRDKWKGNVFVLDNEKRKRIMDYILNEQVFSGEFLNKTEETLYMRYQDICKYIDDKKMSPKEIQAFAFYFLTRLVMVELNISKEDTPMVFEVINDRGEALKPFEILKGKLVGALDKTDSEQYSDIWDASIQNIRGIEDDFFTDYLKARFINKRNSQLEAEINNKYHRYILENNDIAKNLGFRSFDPQRKSNIKAFVQQDLAYYSELYGKIRRNCVLDKDGLEVEENNLKYLNKLLFLSGQYQLILSACCVNDPEENEKIITIAKEYERLYVLLVLNGIYGSNQFKETSYALNEKIKGKLISQYRDIFNEILVEQIKERRNVSVVQSVLEYSYFLQKDYSNFERRQLRYFLARVEQYLCRELKQNMQSTIEDIVTKTGAKNGYHIEHILSHNETNAGYFSSQEEFEKERNQLGGLLLLKGLDNISSNNEEYPDKIKTYSVGLVWGHMLCDDFYHTNTAMAIFNQTLQMKYQIQIHAYSMFDKTALEERNIILYNLVKIIWEV